MLVNGKEEIATLTGTFIVCLKENTKQENFLSLLDKTGIHIHRKYPYGKNIYIIGTKDTTQLTSLDLANMFYETGQFVYCEPNFKLLNVLQYTVNDQYFSQEWPLKSTYDNGIDMMNAWNTDVDKNGLGIKVAILDSGVDESHPDLAGQSEQSNQIVSNDFSDIENFHGTACAGIVAANQNYVGTIGIAHKCHIIPITVFQGGSGYSTDIAEGLNYAWKVAGADVVNCSFGGMLSSELENEAIDSAVCYGRNGLGCVIVASTGNVANGYVIFPARKENVIAVGACDINGNRAVFSSGFASNYGPGIDLVAPGLEVLTTDPTSF